MSKKIYGKKKLIHDLLCDESSWEINNLLCDQKSGFDLWLKFINKKINS